MCLVQGEKSPLQLALDAQHWSVGLLLIKECGASTEEIDFSTRYEVCWCRVVSESMPC